MGQASTIIIYQRSRIGLQMRLGKPNMSLCSKVRSAICNPRKAILYVTLGRSNYDKLTTKLNELLKCSQIRSQNPLEAHMLKNSDMNDTFVIDESRQKFHLTFNPRGYLLRVK